MTLRLDGFNIFFQKLIYLNEFLKMGIFNEYLIPEYLIIKSN